MVRKVRGDRMYLWSAVDNKGEVLDLVMQRYWDIDAALKLLRGLLRNQPVEPTAIVTDGLAAHGSSLRELGLEHLHHPGRLRENNRAENSHLPIESRGASSRGNLITPSALRRVCRLNLVPTIQAAY